MKKTTTSQSAFFNLRVLIGLLTVLVGVFLALVGFGAFSAQAQQKPRIIINSTDPLVAFTSWASTGKTIWRPEQS